MFVRHRANFTFWVDNWIIGLVHGVLLRTMHKTNTTYDIRFLRSPARATGALGVSLAGLPFMPTILTGSAAPASFKRSPLLLINLFRCPQSATRYHPHITVYYNDHSTISPIQRNSCCLARRASNHSQKKRFESATRCADSRDESPVFESA